MVHNDAAFLIALYTVLREPLRERSIIVARALLRRVVLKRWISVLFQFVIVGSIKDAHNVLLSAIIIGLNFPVFA